MNSSFSTDEEDEGHSEDEEPPEEDLEKELPQEIVEKKPLVICLHRQQTQKHIEDSILRGLKVLEENGDKIEGAKVLIQGYERYNDHPVFIKDARKKFVQSIECGLIGFLLANNFTTAAQEVYCTAYAKKPKRVGSGDAKQVQFKNIDSTDMKRKFLRSSDAYVQLLKKQPNADEIFAKLVRENRRNL